MNLIIASEAAGARHSPLDYIEQVTWSSPITNRLLLEAGMMYDPFNFQTSPVSDVPTDRTAISETDTGTGLTFCSAATYSFLRARTQNYRAALSYVTGAHALKVGFTLQTASRSNSTYTNSDLNFTFLNGAPKSLTEYTTPYTAQQHDEILGLYAQDQWTLKRLTLNAGVPFDHLNEYVPATNLPAVQFVGPRNFPAISDVPNWNDLGPRLGVAYDLFGAGKTALKVSLSRFRICHNLGVSRRQGGST